MGTTKTSLQAGSTSFVYVVAIEGYADLLTNHSDTAAVVTAWASTGYTTAIGGLFVDMSVDQSLSPDDPFPKMGSCNLHIVPTPGDDTFGVAAGRKTSTFETYLDATCDSDDTTITVKSTTGVSGGYIHIGTECIAYAGTTATTFTGCTRGKFSPFASFNDLFVGNTAYTFGHEHRVQNDAFGVTLQPVVSSTQRTWIGRWVGVWAHRVVTGVLDVKSEAQLVYAGKILEIRDDPNTFATCLQLKGVTEVAAEAMIGGSQWGGLGTEGLYLTTGEAFEFNDKTASGGTTSAKTATNLSVVASGASGANQISAGYYTLPQLSSAISIWLASEKAAARIIGSYSMTSPVDIGGARRSQIIWTLGNAANTLAGWALSMPQRTALFFGFQNTVASPSLAANVAVVFVGTGAGAQVFASDSEPQATTLQPDGGSAARFAFTTVTGTIVDQYASLPAVLRPSAQGSSYWGVFSINDSLIVTAGFASSSPTELYNVKTVLFANDGTTVQHFNAAPIASASLNVRQIYAFETDPITLITSLLVSTGTSGYNSPYTALPFGCGAAIPYELVRNLPLTMAGITNLSGAIATIIEKPTKLNDLLNSDLVFRWSFLVWNNGGIEAGVWRAPSATLATFTLDDSNKGEPMGNVVNQRSATMETSEWLRQIVKIRYNRNATDPKGDAYKSSIQFEDRVAVDNSGGAPTVVTISLRNTYSEFTASGQSIESLLPTHLALMPLISRPARKLTRSIDPTLFLTLAPGDIVLLTDTFARDPQTGLRGISSRPAMVVKLRYNFGGLMPGADKPTPPGGEVDLFFTDQNPDRLAPVYVPSADINEFYSVASYLNGYLAAGPSIYCYANRFTETSQGVDAVYFAAGDKILIIERDPIDPTNPTQWSRTIASISGNAITLTAALSSPAFDTTKKYHVLYDDYATATSTQHVKAYQADDANGLIISTAQPYLYGTGSPDSTYTANVLPDQSLGPASDIELLPTSRIADGAGRDVAHEAALIRLVNNTIDYKGATQASVLDNTEISNTTVTGTGYQMCAYYPIFLGYEILSTAIYRYLTVAPWARSTDGTSTKVRVTLSLERPSFPTTTNVPWGGTYSQYEWTGITSTTATTLSDGVLTANVKHPVTGLAWVVIELGYKAATRGLAKFVEGRRLP